MPPCSALYRVSDVAFLVPLSYALRDEGRGVDWSVYNYGEGLAKGLGEGLGEGLAAVAVRL